MKLGADGRSNGRHSVASPLWRRLRFVAYEDITNIGEQVSIAELICTGMNQPEAGQVVSIMHIILIYQCRNGFTSRLADLKFGCSSTIKHRGRLHVLHYT